MKGSGELQLESHFGAEPMNKYSVEIAAGFALAMTIYISGAGRARPQPFSVLPSPFSEE